MFHFIQSDIIVFLSQSQKIFPFIIYFRVSTEGSLSSWNQSSGFSNLVTSALSEDQLKPDGMGIADESTQDPASTSTARKSGRILKSGKRPLLAKKPEGKASIKIETKPDIFKG